MIKPFYARRADTSERCVPNFNSCPPCMSLFVLLCDEVGHLVLENFFLVYTTEFDFLPQFRKLCLASSCVPSQTVPLRRAQCSVHLIIGKNVTLCTRITCAASFTSFFTLAIWARRSFLWKSLHVFELFLARCIFLVGNSPPLNKFILSQDSSLFSSFVLLS